MKRQLWNRHSPGHAAPSLADLLQTGAAYTSKELEKFLLEQETQLKEDVSGYEQRKAFPALASKHLSKCLSKLVKSELGLVAKSLSSLLQSRKTRAELVEHAILFDYSYETPDGGHSSSLNILGASCIGMTTDELQVLALFQAFVRKLSKDGLLIKWNDIECDADEKLGEGAYSVVEQAWCQGRLVALKLFKSTKASALQAFMREVTALRACANNPHTIRLLGVVLEGRDKLGIITPLYKGGSIHDAIYKHGYKFPTEQALNIAKDVAEGVFMLHREAALIHRDLTPTNVLLHPDLKGKSFVADFGIAIAVGEVTSMQVGGVVKSPRGHPRYKAPELVSKDPYTEKIDVWQYGTLLYVLFANKRPYESLADREVSGKMASGELPADLYTLPAFITDLILRCWNLCPGDRPSFKEICEEFKAVTPETVTRRRRESGSPRLKKQHLLKKAHSFAGSADSSKKLHRSASRGHCPQNSLLS